VKLTKEQIDQVINTTDEELQTKSYKEKQEFYKKKRRIGRIVFISNDKNGNGKTYIKKGVPSKIENQKIINNIKLKKITFFIFTKKCYNDITMRKLFLFLTFILIVLVSGYYYYLPKVRWEKAVQSASGYPYQIGLTKTIQIPCVITEGVCTGGELCTVKTPGVCATFSEISGTMAGGSGNMALFSNIQTSMAGYKPGDSIIAGVMTPTETENGVLASPGGCSGCGLGKADSSMYNRIASVAKYIIAGFKY
jgi:hypothetical protein